MHKNTVARNRTPLDSVGVIAISLIIYAFFSSGCLSQLAGKSIAEREAEVKSNIHAIQIALERYAVDSGGKYPTFLIGAEREYNIITDYQVNSNNGISRFPVHGMTPFAMGFTSSTTDPEFWIEMDPLIEFDYLAEYPTNPFEKDTLNKYQAVDFNLENRVGVFPYGGLNGDKMFDLGFGWGDTPQTDFILLEGFELEEEKEARISGGAIFSDPDNDAPGNFYYHPIFEDMQAVYFHYAAQYETVQVSDFNWYYKGIMGHEVIGYSLYGYGGQGSYGQADGEEAGLDYFSRMVMREYIPSGSKIDGFIQGGLVLDTSVYLTEAQMICETTGYPSYEYDPWTDKFADGVNPVNPGTIAGPKSGADGILDWVIIEVTSGR